MAVADSIKSTHQALSQLDLTIRAASEVSHLIPEDETLSPFLRLVVDRLEGDFTALRQEVHTLWASIPEEKEEERRRAATTTPTTDHYASKK